MSDVRLYVNQDSLEAHGDSSWQSAKMGKMGFQVVTDFYTQMAIERRVFQVRAGDVATPLVGDAPLIDTKAEASVDTTSGTTIIPVYACIGVVLAPGTATMFKIQSIGVVSSAGTAFVPLPLYMGGTACTSTARVAAAGGVTVTAEVATTARLHFSGGSAIAAGAYTFPNLIWEPKAPPLLNGANSLYFQAGGTTTGPSYFFNLDFIELPTTAVS